ncbi:MAG: hypothetical protein H7Y17_08845 [Chlorobia bacterium]|nr:hypothetical protein [Fimbriimonadaceae bacterium]
MDQEPVYYHAGPPGLTELRTIRDLLDSGDATREDIQDRWMKMWDHQIDLDEIYDQPLANEISLTTTLSEAKMIAEMFDGQVYLVIDPQITGENEEGYPVCQGPVACVPVDEDVVRVAHGRAVRAY